MPLRFQRTVESNAASRVVPYISGEGCMPLDTHRTAADDLRVENVAVSLAGMETLVWNPLCRRLNAQAEEVISLWA